MEKALATVVIPIHLEEPSELEKISLAQTVAMLHKYPISFMAPAGLNTVWYEDFCRGKVTISIERFDWKGHDEFGQLLTSPVFYGRFLGYEYMLVCHMDAFVFRDELEKWCHMGYDYIGAVIYNPYWDPKDSLLSKLTGLTGPKYFGNGGFSLKKVSTFYRITARYKPFIDFYHWIKKKRRRGFLEDFFLTKFFPIMSPGFKIPAKAVAKDFGAAYEDFKEENLPFNNRDNDSLPFGNHGWIQYKRDFWKPVLRRYGYTI